MGLFDCLSNPVKSVFEYSQGMLCPANVMVCIFHNSGVSFSTLCNNYPWAGKYCQKCNDSEDDYCLDMKKKINLKCDHDYKLIYLHKNDIVRNLTACLKVLLERKNILQKGNDITISTFHNNLNWSNIYIVGQPR